MTMTSSTVLFQECLRVNRVLIVRRSFNCLAMPGKRRVCRHAILQDFSDVHATTVYGKSCSPGLPEPCQTPLYIHVPHPCQMK